MNNALRERDALKAAALTLTTCALVAVSPYLVEGRYEIVNTWVLSAHSFLYRVPPLVVAAISFIGDLNVFDRVCGFITTLLAALYLVRVLGGRRVNPSKPLKVISIAAFVLAIAFYCIFLVAYSIAEGDAPYGKDAACEAAESATAKFPVAALPPEAGRRSSTDCYRLATYSTFLIPYRVLVVYGILDRQAQQQLIAAVVSATRGLRDRPMLVVIKQRVIWIQEHNFGYRGYEPVLRRTLLY